MTRKVSKIHGTVANLRGNNATEVTHVPDHRF